VADGAKEAPPKLAVLGSCSRFRRRNPQQNDSPPEGLSARGGSGGSPACLRRSAGRRISAEHPSSHQNSELRGAELRGGPDPPRADSPSGGRQLGSADRLQRPLA
jgi:hypothetical protein